jgi:tRNA nucleotidyltransferase/poly(A) polymerase
MHFQYKPKSGLEKFGAKVYNLLVENFPQTFYVGGMVRDLLLQKPVTDIDIATEAKPDDVELLLSESGIDYDTANKKFGIVVAKNHSCKIEVATFRKDLPGKSRYPKIRFVKSAKQDSLRRDFTINALYLRQKDGKIFDFHRGLRDLRLKNLRFIGKPEKRIKEDPLRMIRALRFTKTLNFVLDDKTEKAIQNNLSLINTLTVSKIKKDLDKIKNPAHKKFILKAIGWQKFA